MSVAERRTPLPARRDVSPLLCSCCKHTVNEAPPFMADSQASEAMNIAKGVRRGGAREEIGGPTWLGNSGSSFR